MTKTECIASLQIELQAAINEMNAYRAAKGLPTSEDNKANNLKPKKP